jgi:hypothetical protein
VGPLLLVELEPVPQYSNINISLRSINLNKNINQTEPRQGKKAELKLSPGSGPGSVGIPDRDPKLDVRTLILPSTNKKSKKHLDETVFRFLNDLLYLKTDVPYL